MQMPRPEVLLGCGGVKSISERLLTWYRRSRRELPWRERGGPYEVWISELMLQQTRVETVVPYFRRFLERFPDLESLAAASEQEVLALWSGLGYYRRARNLHRAAKFLVSERQGRFPDDVEGWLALPGVGRYTAGAIVSIAFDKPAPILDGNVARVLARFYAVRGDPRSGEARTRLWRLAEEVLPERSFSEFNQGLMELGALVCTPRAPRCLVCPIREDCAARRQGLEERLPEVGARPRAVPVRMGGVVIRKRSKLLLYRRHGADLMRDLWEFPMGECRAGEEPREAAVREARDRYGVRVVPGEELARIRHSIMNRRITLHAFDAELSAPPDRTHPGERRWVSPEELSSLPFSSMVLKVLARVR
jgi:A/G-specific adenine glycosylase